MLVTHKLEMDFTKWSPSPYIDVAEGDKYSRNLELTLLSNGKKFVPPEDCTVLIRYQKPNRTGGTYDTMPDGTKAWSLSDNVLTVELVPQLFTIRGTVNMIITLLAGDSELNSFELKLYVQKVPKGMPRSQSYTSISGFIPHPKSASKGQLLKVSNVDRSGRVTVIGVDSEGGTGKSAYEYAVAGGYTGSEEDFSSKLAQENIVVCDLEDATEDNEVTPVNADTFGGKLPSEFTTSADLTPVSFELTAAGNFTITVQRSLRLGKLVICSCAITAPSSVTAGWQNLAITPFPAGPVATVARVPDRVGSGAYFRDFHFDGNALWAYLETSDADKTFILQLVSTCGEIPQESDEEVFE